MTQEFGLFDQFQQSQVYQGNRRTGYGGPGYSDPFRRSQDLSGQNVGYLGRDRKGSDVSNDEPIFKKVKTFNVTKLEEQISHVTVSDEKVVYVQGHQIWQYDLRKKTNTPVELPKKTASPDDKVAKIFQDPTGQHVIISTNAGENYYLEGGKGSKKLKHLSKLRQVFIESIAWCPNREPTDQTTHPIVLGTNKGSILETEIEPQNEELMKALKKQISGGGALEKYVKELHVIDAEKTEKVTGLLIQPFENDKRRFISIVTTPNRIFQFIGDVLNDSPLYAGLFSNRALSFHEIPGTLSYSNFCVWSPTPRDVPRKFAWLTGAGVYFGNLDFSNRDAKSVTIDCELIQHKQINRQNLDSYPLYICMTEFHCILAFRDRFEAVSLLNLQIVFQDNISHRSINIKGMCRDPMTGDVWLYSEKNFNRYCIQNEIRDVWRCYLEKGDYDTAKRYCRINTYQMDRVNRAQAESYFKRSMFDEAAECYAQTSISFEEVALKFIQAEDQHALKIFLLRRLQQLGSEDQTQVTLLSCWLLELMLNQISVLRDQLSSPMTAIGSAVTTLDRSEKEELLRSATREFKSLLEMDIVRQSLDVNRNTAYELLLGHGDTENLLYFATLMQDYERVINHHLTQNQYQRALLMLREQRNKDLYYKFIPVLMKHNPEETVFALKESGSLLNPKKLIPALVQCSQYWQAEQSEHVLEYLEFVVNSLNNKSTSIHNFLISLYCKLRKQDKLISYLEQDWNRLTINYDPEYALRLCTEHKMARACVIIYIILELYHEAVELALDVDIELAKMAANRPENDKDLRKKLWLKIGGHMVKKTQDVAETMQSLDFGELLKIEDILPFFPDFQTIDHFRDVICRTLETYNKEIHDLKEEMTEAQDSARNIRQDIIEVRNRCGIITSSKRCDKCAYSILSSSFFLFPCQHVFHLHCLQEEYLNTATQQQRIELQAMLDKRQSMREFEMSSTSATQQNSDKLTGELEQLQNDIEDVLANDCIYCGDLLIATIDRTFYSETTMEEVSSWAI